MGGTKSKYYERQVGSSINFEVDWLDQQFANITWKKDGNVLKTGAFQIDQVALTDSGFYEGYKNSSKKYVYQLVIYDNLFENEFLGIRTTMKTGDNLEGEEEEEDEEEEKENEEDKGRFAYRSKGEPSTSDPKYNREGISSANKAYGLKQYKMTNNPRGLAVIIAIDTFEDKRKNITGMKEKDIGKCRETFKSLHFEIMECNVTKASDIIEFLRGIANMNHSHYDCFLLYISTHGGHGYMCCSDFKINKKKELQRGYIPFSVLVELFLPDKCSSLSKKPKLFFFDCCRSIIKNTGPPQSPIRVCQSNKEKAVHYADIFIGYATIVGNSTGASEDVGSFYTDILTDCLKEIAPIVSLIDVMVEVSNRMQEKYNKPSHYETTLTRRIVMKNLNGDY